MHSTCCKLVTRRVETLLVADGVTSRPMSGPHLLDSKFELLPVGKVLRIAIGVLVFREYIGL